MRPTTEPRLAFLALAAAVLAAGCFGGSDVKTNAGPGSSPARPPDAQFDETTGALRGQLMDPEFRPIAGADVALLRTDFRTQSALDGGFTLSRVPPGKQTLAIVRVGFFDLNREITVEPNKVTNLGQIVLNPVPIREPYTTIDDFTGLITCSVGTAVLITEECGTGVGTPVGIIGGNPNNKIDWKFNITTVEKLTTVYIEMDWTPQSAAATKLALHVAHNFKCTPGCSGTPTYCDVFSNFGPPVQNCTILAKNLGIKNPDTELPWGMTARAWAPPVKATDVPAVILEQPFKMYRTEFFDMEKPEKYSLVPSE